MVEYCPSEWRIEMQLDKEKELKQEQERCRVLARQVARELAPKTVRLMGENKLLEEALKEEKFVFAAEKETPELFIVVEPEAAELPLFENAKVLLYGTHAEDVASCARKLAEQGMYRNFRWKWHDRAMASALFCAQAEAPEAVEMVNGYEQECAYLHDQTLRAERVSTETVATIERLRSDLALSRNHEQQLETTLNNVTNSTFWKMTWPMRYIVSKSRQIWHTFPLFVFFTTLHQIGISGVMEQAKARREYGKLFPGKVMSADRFATPELLVKQAGNQPNGPKISIVVPLYNTPQNFLEELLDSVQNQTYRNWELCMVDAGQDENVARIVKARARTDSRIRYQKLAENEGIAGNTNHGFEMVQGDYIALLDHDDILHPCALWYVAKAVAEHGADFVYTDEVTFEGDIDHLTVYHFKPDYTLDNLRSNNYICHLSVFKTSLLAKVGGGERAEYNGSQDYDLYLRLTEQAEKVVHIPHLLYYWRSSPTSVASNISAKLYCLEAAVKALYAHYERVGVPVDAVTMIPNTPGFYKTDYTITKPGRVSILIPTCDHIDDLETCIESIYDRTTYPDFEVILIENTSQDPETFRTYERMLKEHPDNLKVITWEGKGFNYSALNNFGEKYATGEYILLLNNDTEVITPKWLEEMVMYAQQERVGCVGVKLLYPDDTIQHAGIGFGFLTLAGHMHKNFPAGHPGYMGRLVYAQDVYAVTAACLMVRKDVYEQVGGLDESFAVAFNDVDFCVRVREAGYTNIFTPFAQLYHYESKSRGLDESPEKRKRFVSEVERFQKRWKAQLEAGDPCMNPNFDLMKEDFTFDIKPLE